MTILVTGATGTIGSEILRLFAQKEGSKVRALLHDPQKVQQVAIQGADPVAGSFEDTVSLQSAMTGVETLILLTPANPAAEEQASSAIKVAKTSGVQKVVRISAIKADPAGPTNNTRAHGNTESEIVQSGLRYVFLRPNLFMQNLFMAAAQVKQSGQFSFATGDGLMGMIDTRDIAACAVECALSDEWDGKIFELTGPDAISYSDVAASLSELGGKPILYQPISPDEMYTMIETAGWGEWMAALARDYGQAYKSNWGNFTTGHVRQITGTSPRSFRTFARDVFLPLL